MKRGVAGKEAVACSVKALAEQIKAKKKMPFDFLSLFQPDEYVSFLSQATRTDRVLRGHCGRP